MGNKHEKTLSDELIAQIANYMKIGEDFILATAACGIREEQAKLWQREMEKAKKKNTDGIYLDLYEATRSARAFAEVIALKRLSVDGGASGAKWILEKINPEKYGKNQDFIHRKPEDTRSRSENIPPPELLLF